MAKEQKHGEVAWSDNSYAERQSGKDLYLKLAPGSNVVRLLTAPYQYYQHKWKFEGAKGFGDRIYCSGAHGSCPVCAMNDKPKRRWLVGAIDRKTNSYKVLDIGWAVYKEIQGYNQDEDWGDPSGYDIDIVVNPKAPPISYYSTVPKPKRPLSASDLLLKEDVKYDYLVDRTTPPTPEKAQERFDMLREQAASQGSQGNGGNGGNSSQWGGNSNQGQNNYGASSFGGNNQNGGSAGNMQQRPQQPKVQTPVDDDNEEFPDYDKSAGF